MSKEASTEKASEKYWEKAIFEGIGYEHKAIYDQFVSLEAKIEELEEFIKHFVRLRIEERAIHSLRIEKTNHEAEYQKLIEQHNLK